MSDNVLMIHCRENSRKALEHMLELGLKPAGNLETLELPCTGRINDEFLLKQLQDGYTGVLVVACHKENCKHLDGNLRAEKHVARTRELLAAASLSHKFVDILFTAPDESRKLASSIAEFIKKIKDKE